MTRTVLILGASGKFGSHAARAFEASGWTVRRFDRRTDDPVRAARGADVIVNGMNPPGYRDWARQVPRITRTAIAAAEASGATLIVPGNVYNFGRQPAPWSAATPQVPIRPKGHIRAEMEETYRAAAEAGRIRVIVLRAGDFIDNAPDGTWLGEILKGVPKGRIAYPGRTDIDHAWTYLPDLGRAAVELAERRAALPAYADVPFPGLTLSGRALAAEVEQITGKPLRMGRINWAAIRLLAPFWAVARGLLEMRYLWDHPHSLDGTRFAELVPGFEMTAPQEALAPLVRSLLGTPEDQGRSTSTQTNRWSEASDAAA